VVGEFEQGAGLRGPSAQAIASSPQGTSEFSTYVQAASPARLTVPGLRRRRQH
jgi:hypothetical protein